MKANGVQITVKDNYLSYRQFQLQLPMATQSPMEIASAARHLFENNYDWHTFVRAVTVRAINLEPKFLPQQLMLLMMLPDGPGWKYWMIPSRPYGSLWKMVHLFSLPVRQYENI
jgi:hypothetical protein